MNIDKIYQKLLKRSRKLRPLLKGKHVHFSYITNGNKILSFGVNNTRKTSPLAYRYTQNIYEIYTCAEVASLIDFREDFSLLKKCTLFSIRLNKRGDTLCAKPCRICEKILIDFSVGLVYYSILYDKLHQF